MLERPSAPDIGEPGDDDAIEPRPWRRWTLGVMAGLMVVLLVAGPVSNLLERSQPQFAENGLQICSMDYCTVQEEVGDAGHGPTMGRLARTVLDADEAQVFADDLAAVIGGRAVTVEVVGDLPGGLAGRYHTGPRIIELVDPVRAWAVVHEVAHTRADGHGADFIDSLLRLVRAVEQSA